VEVGGGNPKCKQGVRNEKKAQDELTSMKARWSAAAIRDFYEPTTAKSQMAKAQGKRAKALFISGGGTRAYDWQFNTHGFAPNKAPDKEVRLAVKQHVGAILLPMSGEFTRCKGCNRHVMDGMMTHALSCKGVAGKKNSRHAYTKIALNRGITQSKASMPTIDEPIIASYFARKPVDITNNTGNQVEDGGKIKVRGDIMCDNILIDVAVCMPELESDRNKQQVTDNSKRGVGAEAYCLHKTNEYRHYVFEKKQFCPFVIESGGHWSKAALGLVKRVAMSAYNKTKKQADYNNTLANICQRVSMATKRGVVAHYAALLDMYKD
jgi:hypothetical protein